MSDSDETVCEDGEGTMSPSIMTAIARYWKTLFTYAQQTLAPVLC